MRHVGSGAILGINTPHSSGDFPGSARFWKEGKMPNNKCKAIKNEIYLSAEHPEMRSRVMAEKDEQGRDVFILDGQCQNDALPGSGFCTDCKGAELETYFPSRFVVTVQVNNAQLWKTVTELLPVGKKLVGAELDADGRPKSHKATVVKRDKGRSAEAYEKLQKERAASPLTQKREPVLKVKDTDVLDMILSMMTGPEGWYVSAAESNSRTAKFCVPKNGELETRTFNFFRLTFVRRGHYHLGEVEIDEDLRELFVDQIARTWKVELFQNAGFYTTYPGNPYERQDSLMLVWSEDPDEKPPKNRLHFKNGFLAVEEIATKEKLKEVMA